MRQKRPKTWLVCLAVILCALLCVTRAPALADGGKAEPAYKTLDELEGKRFAYVNGSVYDQAVEAAISGTSKSFYPSLAECVAAVEAGKADAAVQLSYCCQLAVNRKPGTVTLLPEPVKEVSECFFFPHGSKLTKEFNEEIEKLEKDGTLKGLEEKWVAASNEGKTLPKQDWDAPNGTLKFVTSGVIEPFSYVGDGGKPLGYDVELALIIARDLGYHLEVSTLPMDSIFAAVSSGKADFGGTLTKTPEREEACDFSDAVMPTTISVIVATEGGAAAASSGQTGFFSDVANSFHKTFVEESRWQMILSGLGVTLLIALSSGVLGTLLGYLTVLARRSGNLVLSSLVGGYHALMGGLPLVVVLMVLYYIVFGSVSVPGELVAIVGFTLAFGSTSGSTMWTAVAGLDKIQEECGLALGYTPAQTFRKIIFPQAAQKFLPQLSAQLVSLLKDTAIVGYIAVQDLTRASDLIRARTMDAFFPLIATALIYLLACRLLSWGLGKLLARYDISNRPRTVEGVEL